MTTTAIDFQSKRGQNPARRRTFVPLQDFVGNFENSVLVKSASRVFQILELFDEVQRGLRVSELSKDLGYPQSSTSALLRCMVQLGYLDYDPEGRSYIPSARVTILGSWLDRLRDRSAGLLELLESLAHDTGHTVVLAARNGLYSRYIHVLQSKPGTRSHFPRGGCRPVVWSEMGIALLSHMKNNDIRLLCTRTNAERPAGQPVVQVRDVLTRVEQARSSGYFISRGLTTPGIESVSMLLPSSAGRRANPLAVGITAQAGELIERQIVASMQKMRRCLAYDSSEL
jgi:DNA-binding IclR family transcriptional regulator